MELEKVKKHVREEARKKYTDQEITQLMQELDVFADVIVAYLLKENYDNENK